ncbi:hypothetical protein WN944_019562 [Citrus x changshan-huyou]|uniref:Protein PHLOEM PROTEIN 2-LIKE A1-like n=1 Tax=Citrus x changshan-huyou TaxID=2935761 RepID=A0AAP0QFZ5_9ROSI
MNFKKKVATEANKTREEFLEYKRKKTWIDNKTGYKCFVLYPRSLFVTWGNRDHWTWNCFKETSDENIEVVKLSHVCWMDVRGKFKISELSPGVMYEIVYEVKLTNAAFGWEAPVSLKLSLPADGKVQNRQVSLLEKPRGEWFELCVGNFLTETSNNDGSQSTAEVFFDFFEHGGHWKSGLIIKAAILRPKIN